MRILLIGHPMSSDCMERHVFSTLDEMGHEVQHFQILDNVNLHHKIDRCIRAALRILLREPERLRERRLVEAVTGFRPDLILVLLGNALSPKTVARVRKTFKGPVACWCQDALTSIGRQYLIGAEYDFIFVKDHYILNFLRNMVGHPAAYYLPEACNPEVHKTVDLTESEHAEYRSDICTFATLYYYRQAILEPLRKYDLKVWGNVPDWLVNRLGDQHAGRVVYENDKCKAVAGAKIVLNTLHFAEINGLNCRAFEVAGCGGFQLISFSPAISEHFEIGKEIEVFHDHRELKEKIDYYLARPEARHRIAAASQSRAHKEHTYENRLSRLIDTIGAF